MDMSCSIFSSWYWYTRTCVSKLENIGIILLKINNFSTVAESDRFSSNVCVCVSSSLRVPQVQLELSQTKHRNPQWGVTENLGGCQVVAMLTTRFVFHTWVHIASSPSPVYSPTLVMFVQDSNVHCREVFSLYILRGENKLHDFDMLRPKKYFY